MFRRRSNHAKTPLPLRRTDQAVVGALSFAALLSLAVYWVTRGGHRGELIEIDRADPRRAEFRLDINTADWPELAQLPGIGETLGRRIVQDRAERGPFLGHEDLRRVRGIGPKTLERVRPYLLPLPERATVAER